MKAFQILLLVAMSGLSMGQGAGNAAVRAPPSRFNPAWYIEQPDPFEAPEAYEAPEVPDALLYAAVRNEPGAHQAINNYRQAHRAAYDAHVNNFQAQNFGRPPVAARPAPVPVRRAPAPARTASVPARTAPVPARTAPVPAANSQPSFFHEIERPDPFEAPEAYEAPEIPDALRYAAIRNEPGAHQAINNYRQAHRAAYDAHLNSYRPPQLPRPFSPVRPAPTAIRINPVPVRTGPVPTRTAVVPAKQPTVKPAHTVTTVKSSTAPLRTG